MEQAYLLALQAPVLPRDWSVPVVFDTLRAGESGKGEARLWVRRASVKASTAAACIGFRSLRVLVVIVAPGV